MLDSRIEQAIRPRMKKPFFTGPVRGNRAAKKGNLIELACKHRRRRGGNAGSEMGLRRRRRRRRRRVPILAAKECGGRVLLLFGPREGGRESGDRGKIGPLYLRTRRSLLELTKERNSAEYATMYNVFCVFIPKLTSQL